MVKCIINVFLSFNQEVFPIRGFQQEITMLITWQFGVIFTFIVEVDFAHANYTKGYVSLGAYAV